MKNFYNCIGRFFLLTLFIPGMTMSFAGNFNGEEVPKEIVQKISNEITELPDLQHLSQTCKEISEFTRQQRLAREHIEALIGPLVRLEPGTYIKGPGPGERNPFADDELQSVAEVKNSFRMQGRQISQGQYELVMGDSYKRELQSYVDNKRYSADRFIGKSLPIIIITRAEEDEYIGKLNEKIFDLWKVAYPHGERKLLQFRKPTDMEREYATTKEIEPKVVHFNGKEVTITAEHQLYPVELPERRQWQDGPYSVDDVELKTNERGIQGLAGNVWEVTTTPYIYNGASGFVLRGGAWGFDPADCRSASRSLVWPEDRYGGVGLRLVAE